MDPSYLDQCRKDGILIECRTYDTVYGPWSYFTADDGRIGFENRQLSDYGNSGILREDACFIMERKPLSLSIFM